jgi:transcriptional regulator with XRE-family HTH domain
VNAELGARIRAARTARSMGLRATATAAGVSPSLLSQVETGKIQPSVSTLYSIVSVLGLSVDALLDHHPTDLLPDAEGIRGIGRSPVQHREDSPTIVMENGVTWERMAVIGPGDAVDPLLTTYAPHGASSLDDSHMRHEGVEYGYIIRGELTLKLEFDTYLLRAGDSVCFDSRRPHLYINHTDDITQGIWFVVGHHPHGDGEGDGDGVVRSAVDVLDAINRLSSDPVH